MRQKGHFFHLWKTCFWLKVWKGNWLKVVLKSHSHCIFRHVTWDLHSEENKRSSPFVHSFGNMQHIIALGWALCCQLVPGKTLWKWGTASYYRSHKTKSSSSESRQKKGGMMGNTGCPQPLYFCLCNYCAHIVLTCFRIGFKILSLSTVKRRASCAPVLIEGFSLRTGLLLCRVICCEFY